MRFNFRNLHRMSAAGSKGFPPAEALPHHGGPVRNVRNYADLRAAGLYDGRL